MGAVIFRLEQRQALNRSGACRSTRMAKCMDTEDFWTTKERGKECGSERMVVLMRSSGCAAGSDQWPYRRMGKVWSRGAFPKDRWEGCLAGTSPGLRTV